MMCNYVQSQKKLVIIYSDSSIIQSAIFLFQLRTLLSYFNEIDVTLNSYIHSWIWKWIRIYNYQSIAKKCNHSISTTNAENDAYSFTTFFLSLRIIIQSISIIIHSYTTVVELCTFADKKGQSSNLFISPLHVKFLLNNSLW